MASVAFVGTRFVDRLSFGTALFCLALGSVACSDMDPGTDTFTLLSNGGGNSQTTTRLAADWSCLGDALAPPPTDIPETVTYDFPVTDWVSDLPISGRNVQVCNKVDPQCASPIMGTQVSIVPNQRDVSVTMRGGQNVFLRVFATDDYVADTLWLDGPVYSDQTGGRIQLLAVQTVLSLAASVSLPLDPTGMTGIVAMRAHDCNGQIVSGAIYEIDAVNDPAGAGPPIYPYTFVNGSLKGGVAPGTRTEVVSDSSPWAGFINLRPGPLTVRGFLADTGEEIGSAEIFVQPFGIAHAEIRPLDRL